MRNRQKLIIVMAALGFILTAYSLLKSQETSTTIAATPKKIESASVEDIPSAKEVIESKVILSTELEKSLKELPTVDDLQTLTEEEVHHTPEIVIEGGRRVGQILEEAENHQERRQETIKFLVECAESKNVVPAIRALCWNKTLVKIPVWKVFYPISEAEVPQEIQELGLKIN